MAHVAIRPEAIVATQSGEVTGPNRWNGRLISAIFSGRQQQLVVELAGGRRVNVLSPPTTEFRLQEPVTLELPTERLMPLASDTAAH